MREILERVMIFIDGNNFYHASNTFLKQPPKLKYDLLSELAVNKRLNRYLLRTYYYTVNEPHQQSLINVLKNTSRFSVNHEGYLKKTPIPGSRPVQYHIEEKRTDVNLTTDLLIGAYMNSYDTAIIFSGDTDYLSPIKEIQRIGKIVELVVPRGQAIRREVRETVDDIYDLVEADYSHCWHGTYTSCIAVSTGSTTPSGSSPSSSTTIASPSPPGPAMSGNPATPTSPSSSSTTTGTTT